MKDDQRKAMFAKMQNPQGSRQSASNPFVKNPTGANVSYGYGTRQQLLSYLRNATNATEKDKAREMLYELNNNTELTKASSQKGKYKLVLKADDIVTTDGRVIEGYRIEQYDNNSLRSSSDGGKTQQEANELFNKEIEAWNKYNTSLGKLYVRK
jgi:hypothetical protein